MQDKLNLYGLFERCPHSSSIILYCDGVKKQSISFRELHEYVCYISKFLDQLHLSKSTICILNKPGLALPAIILGILKIASSFAFLDVYKPLDSLLSFQKYLQIKALLIEECYLKGLESKMCCCWKKTDQFYMHSTFIVLQSIECKNNACPNSKVFEKCEMQSEIAYVIQTSGTTGEPKIVQVPHDCVTSNIVDFRSRFSVTTNDVILQSTRITFDPSIIEIFLSLSSGATLVIIADQIRSIPKKLLEVLVDNNITIFQGTPSLISNFGEKVLKEILLKKESVLRVLAFGGEICPSLCKLLRWKSEGNNTEIYNLYGLTEVSCWASCFKIDFERGKLLASVPIGEPLLNTMIEIRNEDGEIADRGELYIGGFKRFCIINNEEWPESSDHVMRPTGDLVYKTPDGFIYFEGRNDSIIKYKGHKISLQLVNNVIESFLEVDNNFLHFDPLSDRLYLFIVWASESYCNSEVERELLSKLRKSISNLPAIILVPVPFIPLTKHGKGDSKKLMGLINMSKKKRISSKSTYEESYDDIISTLWKTYTNKVSIMEKDNFVLSGGDSITAVQFAADIEWHFQLALPLLVEKTLNESFEDLRHYVKLCLKSNPQSMPLYENSSCDFQSVNQSPLKKKRLDLGFECFQVSCKQGCLEYCAHVKESNNCFFKTPESSQGVRLHLSLVFKWDLKKCIDATPCILYLPRLDQYLIFIGSHFGMFSCIDVNNKVEKWHILVPDRIESSACISACGNYALFGCYDHHLYCINITNGNIVWKYKTGAEVKSSPSVSLSNKAFIGSHDKHIYAVDVENGLLEWKKQVAYGSIFSSPAIIETLLAVCVGTLDGVLTLLNMESGDILWKISTGKPFFSSPIITSNFILAGSTDRYLLCLDFEGKEVFKYSTDGPMFSSAAFLKDFKDQVVFGCHDFYLYCITLNGNLVWKMLCDSAVYATPFTFKWNSCYYTCVASSKGTLYILQLSDGKVVFSWNCPGEVFSSPVILNNILAVGCRDNNVYCFNLMNIHSLK